MLKMLFGDARDADGDAHLLLFLYFALPSLFFPLLSIASPPLLCTPGFVFTDV